MSTPHEQFRQRLIDRELTVGTFVKTPSSIVCEALCHSSLDVLCLDSEHAPFGHLQIDQCVAAIRAAGQPSLVRVADQSETAIRNALDCGATGIVVPHVRNADEAERVARAAHFGAGGRGYAGSTRAAGLGTKRMPDHRADSAKQTTVIVQIEDPEALPHVAEISAVENVDAVFIGRIDLAVALDVAPSSRALLSIVEEICANARGCVGMFTPSLDELPRWRDAGASLFLLGSDHSFMIGGANDLADRVRAVF
ncbi:MAG: aldolase/citrate lyase family protein [Pseudomonadota bacterium]